jgi:NAD(P)-dependent dehydrogenase (short-subunit alcohol dehydrogenase family)
MKGVLITGAARRIGAAIAQSLGERGWFVFVHHNASTEEAEAVVAGIRARGGQAMAVKGDLAAPGAARTLLAGCEAHHPLSLLVNNASVFAYDDIATAGPDSLDRNMRVNLYAPVMLSQALAEHLAARDQPGCIINLVDNKVFALNPDYFSYTLSKVALNGLTQMLAMALAPRIRVCGIAPGITLLSGQQTEANFAKAHANNPLGQGCTVEQIVAAVNFILDTPSYNGQTIVIDGGQNLEQRGRDVAFLSDEA